MPNAFGAAVAPESGRKRRGRAGTALGQELDQALASRVAELEGALRVEVGFSAGSGGHRNKPGFR